MAGWIPEWLSEAKLLTGFSLEPCGGVGVFSASEPGNNDSYTPPDEQDTDEYGNDSQRNLWKYEGKHTAQEYTDGSYDEEWLTKPQTDREEKHADKNYAGTKKCDEKGCSEFAQHRCKNPGDDEHNACDGGHWSRGRSRHHAHTRCDECHPKNHRKNATCGHEWPHNQTGPRCDQEHSGENSHPRWNPFCVDLHTCILPTLIVNPLKRR